MRAVWLPAVVAVVVLSACGESTRPGGITAMQRQPCEENPELCGGGGGGGGGGGSSGDPAPTAAGYYIGSSFSVSACVSPTGTGINDVDGDGLDDYCEHILAMTFRPAIHFSVYDCDTGGERYWAAKVFPAQGNLVRIAYLPSYYVDCGAPSESFCSTIYGCGSHNGDSEFIILDLRYNATTQHWYLEHVFLSAHTEFPGNSAVDNSSKAPGNFAASALTYPDKLYGIPDIWVAEGKHGNYSSRAACDAGGPFGFDTCDSNPDSWVQFEHSRWHNVGSIQANFINTGTCVTGGRLVATYPDMYGIECYWVPNDDFQGWSTATALHPSTPYYNWLFSQFECYSYPTRQMGNFYNADFAWVQAHCTDWGVRRW